MFVSTQTDARDQIISQACIAHASLLAVTPVTSGPVAPGTTVHYDVSVTDNDVGACPNGKSYEMFFDSFDSSISTVFVTDQFQIAQPGQTLTFGIDVTGNEDATEGEHDLSFVVDGFSSNSETLFGQLVYVLTPPSGCFVSTRKELMITSTSVVDDPVRTAASAVPAPGVTATPGVWTLGHLMRELAPTPEDAPAMTLQLFQHWLSDQTVNGFTFSARPRISRWCSTPGPRQEYNAALEEITKRFAGRNAQPGAVNGSALDELRTNEIALFPQQWELRGFALSAATGFLDQVATDLGRTVAAWPSLFGHHLLAPDRLDKLHSGFNGT